MSNLLERAVKALQYGERKRPELRSRYPLIIARVAYAPRTVRKAFFTIFAFFAFFVSLVNSPKDVVRGQEPQARIKIDIDRAIGEVHPHLFGNFAEHLGRMIYGGIYEEGSPLSDKESVRLDVLEAVKGLNVSLLRYPGGNFVSGYDWKDGIGPKDQRPARPELAWGGVETNRFGTDEFLRYCERIGA
jgi:hypothetical protein